MTPGARGHRAGGSEDPPLQLTGGARAVVRMRGPGSAALAAISKGERTQRGTVLGAIGGHGSLQKERLDLGFLGSLAERGALPNDKSLPEVGLSIKFRGLSGRVAGRHCWRPAL
jgi:hypothetical protein